MMSIFAYKYSGYLQFSVLEFELILITLPYPVI